MSVGKDYVHINYHLQKANGGKMSKEDLDQFDEKLIDLIEGLGFEVTGSLRLEDDDELLARTSYDPEIIEEAAIKYAAIPEEGPNELNGDLLNGFIDGAKFIVSIIDKK